MNPAGLYDDEAQVLAVTVNCRADILSGRAIMGAGAALEFADNCHPGAPRQLGGWILDVGLRPGQTAFLPLPDGRVWAAMATKDMPGSPSRVHWVKSALVDLRRGMRERGLTSVALPLPGCGNGHLDPRRVVRLVAEALGGLDYRLYTVAPAGHTDPMDVDLSEMG